MVALATVRSWKDYDIALLGQCFVGSLGVYRSKPPVKQKNTVLKRISCFFNTTYGYRPVIGEEIVNGIFKPINYSRRNLDRVIGEPAKGKEKRQVRSIRI